MLVHQGEHELFNLCFNKLKVPFHWAFSQKQILKNVSDQKNCLEIEHEGGRPLPHQQKKGYER